MKLIRRFIIVFGLLLTGSTVYSAIPEAASVEDKTIIDNTPDSLAKARTARPVSGSTRVGDNPVLFLVGNSTMRTGTMGNGDNGQWGWGYYFPDFFDSTKITVENQALGGMSSRTFYTKLWDDVKKGMRPGDWVIIELGHNDNGKFDSGRARATIKGIGNDSLNVTIQETGEKETVYSYGEYMRRYIREAKALGVKPILMSLTPRNAWDDADSTIVTRVNQTFGLWAKQVAEAEGVPFIDLNDITACKYERFGKEKVKDQMFYSDRIHTTRFGAMVNAESAAEGIRAYPGLELKEYLKPQVVDTITGSSRKGRNPVVFVIGDSTVKNKDSEDGTGMWGWGSLLAEYMDTDRITVENHAMAGRSARTFLNEGRWDKVYNALQPGDWVLIEFGHNDRGAIHTGKARAELDGVGPEKQVFKMEKDGRYEAVYTFGWYLRKFIQDAREKGANVILLSSTVRNIWNDGKIESNADGVGGWTRQVAEKEGVGFVDVNALTGDKLQKMGKENVASLYIDHTHTGREGAEINAASVAEGIKAINSPLAEYLKNDSTVIAVFGDSYVRNHRRPYTESWHYKAAKELGLKYVNVGRNGSAVSFENKGFGPAMTVRMKSELPRKMDMLLIIAGHNDASKMTNDKGLQQFRDSLNTLITYVRENYPQCKIGYVLPWHVNRGYFSQVIDLIKEVCKERGVPVFDAETAGGIKVNDDKFRYKYFQDNGIKDTAHLNDAGHNLIVSKGKEFIRSVLGIVR